ncbi:hypothetical protein L6452_35206 [Arctium lappa]|uniref:Uncharacterized protein n=1 Tax=Arctium lappa TaxID=4217 RepID=A0ACB8Y6H8_ARCLA|nr:hypothetical protein L6452_35206 [Arctium lappa]
MASHKVTKMVLDVDLNCSDCYKKVKKVICKIPEIRDQEYDVAKNKVKISVTSCCPDKIRDKLRQKGGSSIQKIEIIVEKPKDPKPKDDAAKPKPKPPAADHEKPKKAPKGDGDGDGDSKKPQVAKKMMFEPPVHGYPQIMYPPTTNYPAYPVVGYGSYEGSYGAPFQGDGYGMPPQPSRYGPYDYGYNQNNMSSRNYENPQGCSIM